MIFDSDLFCRSVILPVQFDGDRFDVDKCLDPHKTKSPTVTYRKAPTGGSLEKVELQLYGLSLGSRAILKDVQGAHRFGCSSVIEANRRLAELFPEGVPESKRRYYVGFYDLPYKALRTDRTEYYDIELKYKPEGSTDAHFQLSLRERISSFDFPEGANKSQRRIARENDRLRILARITAELSGPFKHVCEQDEQYRTRLEGIILPTLPTSGSTVPGSLVELNA